MPVCGELRKAGVQFLGERLLALLRPVASPPLLDCAMAKHHPRNRAIAEEAVHPLDDFRRDLLKQGRERALDDKRQRAAVALAAWKTDRIGGGHLRIAIAHDLRDRKSTRLNSSH